jgi:RNA polymerase primary sigma factor
MQLCVRDARMPRPDFLKQFPGNETNLEWLDDASGSRARSKYAEALKALQPDDRAVAISRS